jgi:5-methylthioadenosine/S-adenosylhomocysteine deaminase
MESDAIPLPADVAIVGECIAEIGDVAPRPGDRVIDAAGCAVLPGFVQTHVHLCQSLFRGFADDLRLLDWLRLKIWPFEAAHTSASLRASARLGIAELLRGGTTTILDMGTVRHTGVLFETAAESGIRYLGGKCMMDDPSVPPGLREGTDDSLGEAEELARTWNGRAGGRIRYAWAPRFALSCTANLLAGVRERRAGLLVHTHAAEQVDEVAEVLRLRGARNVTYFDQLGLTGERLCLAHCVHLDEAEIETLSRTGTRVLHCPSANLKLGSGLADIARLKRAGVRVSLGADGAPCNNRLDQFAEMRAAAQVAAVASGPGALSAAQVLRMATRDGAEALGLATVGSLTPGWQADLQVISLAGLHLQPDPAPLASRLVYAATPADVRDVFVAGRQVVAGHRLLVWPEAQITVEASAEATALAARTGV